MWVVRFGFGWLGSRCGMHGMVWAPCGLVDGSGWLTGASYVGGLLLACWVSFFSPLWARAIGFSEGHF